tara:strand:+ start:11138 stop:12514 length:1377 start_codon:yes stop_codon:yes gene_type:complete
MYGVVKVNDEEFTYLCRVQIPQASDLKTKQFASFVLTANKRLYHMRRETPYVNNFSETLERIHGDKDDPVIKNISICTGKCLGIYHSRHAYDNIKYVLRINVGLKDTSLNNVEEHENKMILILERKKPFYILLGHRITKKNLMNTLSRILYKSLYVDSVEELTAYAFKLLNRPENVNYVLENRAPFHFMDSKYRNKINVRLNVNLIDHDTAAMEISDGVWAKIKLDDLDTFVNTFHHNKRRSKRWRYISPRKLWINLMGEEPTDSQLKLMINFLKQNRTQDIVENRAKELMQSLTVKYPDRIKILENSKNTIMLVRGKICDWVIHENKENQRRSNIQKVSTYVFIRKSLMDEEQRERVLDTSKIGELGFSTQVLDGDFRGPICIDNIHTNSSTGDQFAARALALLNDKLMLDRVYTIKKYIPSKVLNNLDIIKPSHFDWDIFERFFVEKHTDGEEDEV